MKKEDLIKLGKLSKIKLSDKEIEKYTPEMSSILESAKGVASVDTKGIDVYSPHSTPLNMLRKDKVKSGLTQNDVLTNAPYSKDWLVIVYGKISENIES